jgi:polyphosphate kinase 2
VSIARSSKKETTYRSALRGLQIELVRLQRHLIETGGRLLILLEGRDGAGKDGAIKAVLEHMSPRESRAVALGKPSDREATQWYFQRYVPHLPAGGEFVLFNRSWYNRAGVEHVMGFCSQMAYEDFLTAVPVFEDMLIRDGVHLFKYYLDIDKAEQKRRLDARREDPLKQWKISPIDEAALKHWKDYSRARDTMLSRTSTPASPWLVVQANDKRVARLNLIRDLLSRVEYKNKGRSGQLKPDRAIVFPFETKALTDGRLSK